MNAIGVRAFRIIAWSLIVGTFFTMQTMLMALASGRGINAEWDVLQEALFWAVWALLAPVVVAAARRWPLDARPLRSSVTVHILVSAALAPLQTIVAFGLHLVALVVTGRMAADGVVPWMKHTSGSLVWGVFMGVFFYWVVVGVYTALHFRRLYAAERVSAAELAGRSARLEAELTRAHLDALRSQLRPHFLFNTLNAIAVLTADDAEKARRMILRLGSLLRRSLDEEHHEVSLEEELRFLDEYLDIQRARFGDRLSVTSAIDPSAATARVPVLLLQPLIENALEHGAPEDGGTTVITLSIARAGDTVRVTIEDSGPGPPDVRDRRDGVGLRNTRERLRQLYGDRAVLTLGRRSEYPRGGGCVEVVLPFSPVTPVTVV
jgi:two-component system LytT family sensor kinase